MGIDDFTLKDEADGLFQKAISRLRGGQNRSYRIILTATDPIDLPQYIKPDLKILGSNYVGSQADCG